MAEYVLVGSQDPYETADGRRLYELAGDLVDGGDEVTVFLVQNGVLPCRAQAVAANSVSTLASRANVVADEFSLRERAIPVADVVGGVRVAGIDGWSWDAPFVHTAKKYAETHDPTLIWEGHKAGRHIGYCHIEKLHNLESLPSTGFTVACFPVKIARASAGWTRAVAIIED